MCAGNAGKLDAVLTIITDEQLEAFADAVITKYQQSIARQKAAEKPQEEWMTRKEVMVGGKHLYRKADVMRILNGGRK